jgi:hypothetical protein
VLTKKHGTKFLAAAEKQEFVSHIFLATFENSHFHFFQQIKKYKEWYIQGRLTEREVSIQLTSSS